MRSTFVKDFYISLHFLIEIQIMKKQNDPNVFSMNKEIQHMNKSRNPSERPAAGLKVKQQRPSVRRCECFCQKSESGGVAFVWPFQSTGAVITDTPSARSAILRLPLTASLNNTSLSLLLLVLFHRFTFRSDTKHVCVFDRFAIYAWTGPHSSGRVKTKVRRVSFASWSRWTVFSQRRIQHSW